MHSRSSSVSKGFGWGAAAFFAPFFFPFALSPKGFSDSLADPSPNGFSTVVTVFTSRFPDFLRLGSEASLLLVGLSSFGERDFVDFGDLEPERRLVTGVSTCSQHHAQPALPQSVFSHDNIEHGRQTLLST